MESLGRGTQQSGAMSLRSGKLAQVPSAGSLGGGMAPSALARGATNTQSASTVAGHLGSSASSSSRSEADPSDESCSRRRSSEGHCRSAMTLPLATGATSPRSGGPRTPRRGSPSAPLRGAASTPRGGTSRRRDLTPPQKGSGTPRQNGSGTPRQNGSGTPRQNGSGTPRQQTTGSTTPRNGTGTPRQRREGEEGVREEVKVVVRVRPPLEQDRTLTYFADQNDQTKLLSTPVEGMVSFQGGSQIEEFGFSRVIAPTEDNLETFKALGLRELIDGVCKGFQETVFAYGQTGSGKTHTILGSGRSDYCFDESGSLADRQRIGEPGLLQLCTHELFHAVFSSSRDSDTRRYIQLVCLEIKNEDIIDLLPSNIGGSSAPGGATPRSTSGTSTPRAGAAGTGSRSSMHVTQENISLKGKRVFYRKVTAWSYEETMLLLREAIASREVGASSINSESSRSHMVVRFFVKTLPAIDAAVPGATSSAPQLGTTTCTPEEPGVIGSLTLVDLAGNEREVPETTAQRALVHRASGHRAREQTDKGEAKAINVSLTHLNRMLLKMQNGQLDESDRRQGTLNMILYDFLREDCGTTMIFCIHPDRRFALSARSTLQMALRCRRIVRRKQVRRLEPAVETGGSQTELHRTAQLLQELRHRYEEKTKDLETVRAKLENRHDPLAEDQEDMEPPRKDELMRLLCEQLRRLESKDEHAEKEAKYLELQRRFESQCWRSQVDDAETVRKALVDEDSLKQLELARSRDVQGFEERCSALENFYREQLKSVQEAHDKELKSLKDALQLQGIAAEASPPDSSAGEPCSEPSMQSSRASRAGSQGSAASDHEARQRAIEEAKEEERLAAEVLQASRQLILQAATPQHCGTRGAQRKSSDELDKVYCPATISRPVSQKSLQSVGEQRPVCQDVKPALSKTEKVLVHLQQALGQDALEVDAQPFEASEAYLGQLSRLAVQGRIEPQHRAQSIDLALKAVLRHGSSLKIRRDVAKLLLEIASKDSALKEDMIAKGAIRLTIDTLQFLLSLFPSSSRGPAGSEASTSTSEAAAVCSASFRLLATLCHKHREPTAHAALDAVLHCLAVPQMIDTDSSINGCYLIMTLVDKRPELQELVRVSDGIWLLTQLLDARVSTLEESEMAARSCPDATIIIEPASATLCYYIAGCLAKVVQDNEQNQQALYQIGGVNLLLRTLKTCLQSGEVVGNACMAIAFTLHQHEQMQNDARAQGAIEVILDALLAYRGESSVQIGVCRAIATLTERNVVNQEAFLSMRLPDETDVGTGVISMLLQALGCKPVEEPLVTTMCWALSNLIVGQPDAMEHVRLLAGMEVIISLLRRFAKEERACEYLCRLLAELVRGDSAAAQRNRQELRGLGAKEAITAMAQHHAQSNGFVLVRVRDALQNLSIQNSRCVDGRLC